MKKPTDADQLAIEAVPYVNGSPLPMPSLDERLRQYKHSVRLMDATNPSVRRIDSAIARLLPLKATNV